MDREFLISFRRTCIMIAVFAGSFIAVYAGVVAMTKFVYVYFRGFIPEFNENILRVIFYALALCSFAAFRVVFKRRYSRERLGARVKDPDGLVRYMLMTHVIGMALAESVLICAFFLFFLSAMYVDFIILSLLSALIIFMSVPGVDFLDSKIKDASKVLSQTVRKT